MRARICPLRLKQVIVRAASPIRLCLLEPSCDLERPVDLSHELVQELRDELRAPRLLTKECTGPRVQRMVNSSGYRYSLGRPVLGLLCILKLRSSNPYRLERALELEGTQTPNPFPQASQLCLLHQRRSACKAD